MIKLIKLELQRINMRPYIVSSVIFGIVLLAFTYFIAYVAQVEQEIQFMAYENIFRFTGAISMILFGILSATMYARLVIGEYAGKRLALLFSYPVSRKKIFVSKVLIVSVFVMVSMILCTAVSITIFVATESFSPIVSDIITSRLLMGMFKMTVISLTAVTVIGLLAMRIGFIKKSVPATLITSFVLSGIYGNMAIGADEKSAVVLPILVVSLLVALAVLFLLSNKINHMEVE